MEFHWYVVCLERLDGDENYNPVQIVHATSRETAIMSAENAEAHELVDQELAETVEEVQFCKFPTVIDCGLIEPKFVYKDAPAPAPHQTPELIL